MGKIIEKNYDMEAKLNKKIVVISDIHYYNKKDEDNQIQKGGKLI